MIEVEINEDMKQRAWKKAREMGKLNHSITNGSGNIAGFLGEEVANYVIKGTITNTYDYDIVDEHGIKYDVKTKRCTSKPKDYYECSIAEYNLKQQCNYYAFVRVEFVNNKWGRAWYLGVYDKQSYFKDARLLKEGDIDSDNNFRVKANCYNMPIKQLVQILNKDR